MQCSGKALLLLGGAARLSNGALTGSSERPDLASGQMPERQTSEELQSHFEEQLEGAETPDSLLQEGDPYGRCELV